ncbi:MAG: hypothetical protein IJ560_02355 [Alphaproteobacteria bacterium]|nr:hypothetical protein [Alphaproteobacteria bacterium]
MNIITKLRTIVADANVGRIKKFVYVACVCAVVLWIIYRFVAIAIEGRMDVFNAARDADVNGAPVMVMTAHETNGVLREPMFVRSNRAYISGGRIGLFRVGYRVGDGKIISVSSDIDLDTGMYVVRTTGVADGETFMEYTARGFFVPVYAVENNTVMVMENGVATSRTIKTSGRDADNVVITDGISDGDVVILSNIANGARVRIQE